MSREFPKVDIRYFSKANSYDGDFSTMFIVFIPFEVPNTNPILINKRYQFEFIEEVSSIDFVKRAISAFYGNGGDRLYLLFYQIENNFDIVKFDYFLSQSCDKLTDIETIVAINIYDDTIQEFFSKKDILEIQRVINDYCEKTHRISISDIESDFKKEYLNIIGKTNIYYPWIVDNQDNKLPPSIYVSALFSKKAKADKYFESVANIPLYNAKDVDIRLDNNELLQLVQDSINPVIFMPHRGVMIWGVKCFNEHIDTVNELRVMKYIKRKIVKSSRVYVFENNNRFLEAQIILMLKVFFDNLENIGAIESYSIQRDINSMKRENEIVINIEVALSTPVEFINIRFHKGDRDGNISIISL